MGFMSRNQQEPDTICEIFVLSPADLVDEAELHGAAGSSRLTADSPSATFRAPA